MSEMIFDEQTMLEGNIFQFENRLKSSVNRYTENGMLLSTYFSINENTTTVDRGIQDIEQLFGARSPLRFNKINNLPLNNFTGLNIDNVEENNIDDFNISGDFIIIPGLIVPKQNDVFFINHLKMTAIFIVTGVTYDSMKLDGNYKVSYRLHSTSENVVKQIESQVDDKYNVDLNAIGTDMNPVIKEDNFILREKINKMSIKMIDAYKALYYNSRHNCFIFYDQKSGIKYFDMCGNEFMAKHGLMNYLNSSDVICLHQKIRDVQLPVYYMNSIYNWIEMDAPARLLQKFPYITYPAEGYPDSSFERWGEGDIEIIFPLSIKQDGKNVNNYFFDSKRLKALLDTEREADANEYDRLIWKFINKPNGLTINDISLYTADALLTSINDIDIYLLTPIILYIIKKVLSVN